MPQCVGVFGHCATLTLAKELLILPTLFQPKSGPMTFAIQIEGGCDDSTFDTPKLQ